MFFGLIKCCWEMILFIFFGCIFDVNGFVFIFVIFFLYYFNLKNVKMGILIFELSEVI